MLYKTGRMFSGEPGVLIPWLLCCDIAATNGHSKVTRVITDPARLKPIWFRLCRVRLHEMSLLQDVGIYCRESVAGISNRLVLLSKIDN